MVGEMGAGPAPGERQAWVDTTRGLGVLAVVLFHVLIWNYAVLVDGSSTAAKVWDGVGNSLGRIRMPILFAISGLLARRRLLLGWRAGSARLRLVRNAYLYAVWVALYGLFFAVLARPGFPHSINTPAQLALQTVFPTTTLWFLFALAVYPVVLVLLRALRVPRWGILLLATVAWFVGANLPVALFGGALLQNFVFFALGVVGAGPLGRFSHPGARRFLTSLAFFLLVVLGGHRLDGLAADGAGFLASTSAVPLAVASAALLCRWAPAARLGTAVGRRTLAIYLLHVPLLGLWSALARPSVTWIERLLRTPGAEILYPPLVTAALVLASLSIRSLLGRLPGDALFTAPAPLLVLAAPGVGRGTGLEAPAGGASGPGPRPEGPPEG